MLTMFALPKPFRGHIGVIQHNAIASWIRLRPRPEIILFGNEEGTAQIARELGVRHIPNVPCNEYGTPLMSGLFELAHSVATSSILCYINSDILVLCDFVKVIQQAASWREQFLMTGCRLNVDLDVPEAYASADSEARLQELIRRQNLSIPIGAMDYFVFPRGLFRPFPPFTPGGGFWDNWLVWKALSSGVPVIDASEVVYIVHQNHGKTAAVYDAINNSEEGRRNQALTDGNGCTREHATHIFTSNGIKSNFRQRLVKRLLAKTRGLRHAMGIRRKSVERFW
jgi:hypothetical protein